MPTPLLDNRQLGPDTARANLLVNGGFEIWQRGQIFSASGLYTADRWQMLHIGSGSGSCQYEPSADGTFPSKYSMWMNCTGTQTLPPQGNSIANGSLIQQKVEDHLQLRSRTVTFSIRVMGAGNFQLFVNDGVAQYNSATFTGTGVFATYSFTATLASGAVALYVGIMFGSVLTFHLDNAMLVVGTQAADYAPLPPADELARCMRYYETSGAAPGYPLICNYAGAGSQVVYFSHPYKAQKPIAPTVTIAGTWATSNATLSAPSVANSNVIGTAISLTSVGAGQVLGYPNSNGMIVIEANP